MRLHTPFPMGEALDLIMGYEEAYDLMNHLHEALCQLDSSPRRSSVTMIYPLKIGNYPRWPSVLRTVVTSREN